MRPVRAAVWGLGLLLWGIAAGPADAAWCNVFQVCWCRHKAAAPVVSSYYAPAAAACCDPCPQPVCTTRYVQRCYYQPVTTYQTQTYYEPVTTYQTSYYYEPVTSYRYSCYYDPCTCSYQQVACPTTCYRLRSQCCPVQSWVQRCCSVPVTSYRQCFYYEPVTSCCTPTSIAAPCPPAAEAAVAVPANVTPAPPAAPGVSEQRAAPAPGVSEQPGRTSQQYYGPSGVGSGSTSGSSYRLPPAPVQPPPPPRVRLDGIVSVPRGGVEGQVVRSNSSPVAGAQLLFISTDARSTQQVATTDASGQFRAPLASGSWLVYLPGADGRPAFHSKIDVRANQSSPVMLVSR